MLEIKKVKNLKDRLEAFTRETFAQLSKTADKSISDNENEGLFKLLASVHDEEIVEISIGYEDEMKDVIERSLDMVNKTLKVEIPFGCDIQFGYKYSEIH